MVVRNIFFSVMVFVGLCAQAQQPARPFELKGTIQGMDKGWLYLHYSTPDGKRLKDSAEVKKEKFTFRGKIDQPTMGYLVLKEEKRDEEKRRNIVYKYQEGRRDSSKKKKIDVIMS